MATRALDVVAAVVVVFSRELGWALRLGVAVVRVVEVMGVAVVCSEPDEVS